MGWQDNIVYDSQNSASPSMGWQNAIVYDNDNKPQTSQDLRGEEAFRQLGLAGRDLAGAVPMAIAGVGDLGNMAYNAGSSALNNYAGTNLPQLNPTAPTDAVQKGLSATGMFPEYQNSTEKNIGNVAAAMFGGGEAGYNTVKQGLNNIGDQISGFRNSMPMAEASSAAVPEATAIIPTSSDIKLIKEKLDLAGITPQQYADALEKSGPDDFAGELGGDPLRMQTQAQAKVTGPAMQEARDAMRQRMAEAPQRTAEIIGQSIKPAENVNNMLQNIEDMKAQAGPLYEEAKKATVPWDEFSNIIGTPSGQKALQQTIENFSNEGRNLESMGFQFDQNGKATLADEIPIETMHQIQRNIGTQVERDALGRTTSAPGNQVLENQQTGITSKLAELNPTYQKALNISAGYKQAENAFSLGRQLAKGAAGEKTDAIMQMAEDKMSPNELSYRNAGYAQGLTDAASGAPLGTGSPASRIATGKVQNSVGSIVDSPTQAQQFSDLLVQEKNRVDLAQRGLGGSNTAETLTSGVPEISTSPHGVVAMGLNKVKDFLQAGKNERLAQLLYATAPDQKALLAKMVLGK